MQIHENKFYSEDKQLESLKMLFDAMTNHNSRGLIIKHATPPPHTHMLGREVMIKDIE